MKEWETMNEGRPIKGLSSKPPNTVLQLSVRRIFLNHQKKGVRGAKSTSALQLATVAGFTAKEIAARLKTSAAYVNQLISHDYKAMYEDCLEEGITGADL